MRTAVHSGLPATREQQAAILFGLWVYLLYSSRVRDLRKCLGFYMLCKMVEVGCLPHLVPVDEKLRLDVWVLRAHRRHAREVLCAGHVHRQASDLRRGVVWTGEG